MKYVDLCSTSAGFHFCSLLSFHHRLLNFHHRLLRFLRSFLRFCCLFSSCCLYRSSFLVCPLLCCCLFCGSFGFCCCLFCGSFGFRFLLCRRLLCRFLRLSCNSGILLYCRRLL